MREWNKAAKARNDFADVIEGLNDRQLAQPTYCAEWTPQQVLCHLTSFAETTFLSFFKSMRRARFNFDAASQGMAAALGDRPVEQVVASLRARAAKSAAMPMFPEALVLADVLIHTQDVRRPLQLEDSLDPALTVDALDFITGHKMAKSFVERRPLEGVRLVASDASWSFGDGPEISGTAEALLMGIAGRPVLDDLSGDGLAHWA